MQLLQPIDQFEKNCYEETSLLLKTLLFLIAIAFLSPASIQAQAPDNDLCTTAELIMAPTNPGELVFAGSGSTLTATTTDYPPSCGSGVDNSTSGGVWYTFEGESNTLYTLSTCNPDTDFDTEISVQTITGSGSCMTDMVCQAGNDNASCTSNGNKSTVSIFTPAGLVPSSYYVYVTGDGTATGDFSLSITHGPPLPVELISFEGTKEEKSNRLIWKTASELNTETHIIERSVDGSSGWKEIGDIPAIGFSADIQHYDYEDFDPPSKAFYRLRSVDFDRKEGLSKVVFLERESNDFGKLSLSPNPTKATTSLSFNLEKNTKVGYTLMDVQGKVMRQWSSNIVRGSHEEEIDLSDLQSGIYFLQLNNGTEISSRRILRLRD